MWAFVARRFLLAVPTLLGASVIVFAMVHLAPGDPIAAGLCAGDVRLVQRDRLADGGMHLADAVTHQPGARDEDALDCHQRNRTRAVR